MGMGDCARCIKYLLFVFNLIFCLLGLAILATGIWVYVKGTSGVLPEELKVLSYAGVFLLVIGSIITLLGFLGCCGAIFENRCLLVLFFILLLIVFLILLASGIVFLVMRDAGITAIETYFTKLVENQKFGNDSESKNETDRYQSLYQCCGGKLAEKDYTSRNISIPESCEPAKDKIYVSCTQLLNEPIIQGGLKIAIAIFVAALVAFLGMIFSMMLCCAITDMA